MKVVVFDLGGTLTQYAGMPHSWVDFYNQGFEAIIQKVNCRVTNDFGKIFCPYHGTDFCR